MIGLIDFISDKLVGGVWHTTSKNRFKSILVEGSILVEPDLPERERYGGMPFVRSLGGVSLFDFPSEFDIAEYYRQIPFDSLGEFVPFKQNWGHSVWLKIDKEIIAENFRSGKEIRKLWRSLGSTKRFMAEIEAACIGSIPVSAIQNSYYIADGDHDWTPIVID
ncbi:MAG: hypothetical protein ACSHYC_22465 [Alphaproteobacteria bacterium]